MAPFSCTERATAVTVVRCTPSMSARNSWVSATVLLEMRSWQVSSQRAKRASTECSALQATDWIAWPNSASVWRSTRSRIRGLLSQASCSVVALMRQARGDEPEVCGGQGLEQPVLHCRKGPLHRVLETPPYGLGFKLSGPACRD